MYYNSSSLTNIQDGFNKILHNNLDSLKKDLKKNKKLSWVIPIIGMTKKYSNHILILFMLLSLYFSEQVINVFEFFLLFDSIIISLLILKNNTNKHHPRRLAKNVISLFILYTNFIGSLASIVVFFLIYLEFNKFINKIIFQIIDQIISFLSNTLPFIKDMYPNLKLVDHNKGIESTELTNNSDSDSSSSSSSYSSSSSSRSSRNSSSSRGSSISNSSSILSKKNLSSNISKNLINIFKNNDKNKYSDSSSTKEKKNNNEFEMYNKIIKNMT
jgi:uncharacterized membrane protein YgcG